MFVGLEVSQQEFEAVISKLDSTKLGSRKSKGGMEYFYYTEEGPYVPTDPVNALIACKDLKYNCFYVVPYLLQSKGINSDGKSATTNSSVH